MVTTKIGASVSASGTVSNSSPSTVTFSPSVTFLTIVNLVTNGTLYVRLNGSLSGTTQYDYKINTLGTLTVLEEDIEIASLNVFISGAGASVTLPHASLQIRGW